MDTHVCFIGLSDLRSQVSMFASMMQTVILQMRKTQRLSIQLRPQLLVGSQLMLGVLT